MKNSFLQFPKKVISDFDFFWLKTTAFARSTKPVSSLFLTRKKKTMNFFSTMTISHELGQYNIHETRLDNHNTCYYKNNVHD